MYAPDFWAIDANKVWNKSLTHATYILRATHLTTGKSAVIPTLALKSDMRAITERYASESANVKTRVKSPEVKRACAGVETTGRPRHAGSPNRVPTWAV